MTLNCRVSVLFPLSILALFTFNKTIAGDPDIIFDFTSPQNYSVNGSFFTYTGLRGVINQIPLSFKATKVTMVEFPALNGQSISYALFQYPAGSINPPHTHPRAAELLFLVSGSLQVGFVDTKRTLYTQNLQPGDMFIFPKGLIHYQYNPHSVSATAISAFGSVNAGTVSIPLSIFGTGIDDVILAKAFNTDIYTVKKLRSGLNKS
ncbi:RmlC-like cupin domain superfamily [Sesbania bispinosa]|nr:RmlC-like cupin domain superfamily [Sesbania bispinosa]